MRISLRFSTEKATASGQAQRKNQQFCRQVQRALNLALADSAAAGLACELFVDEVSPALDWGHLLVHIVLQDGHSVAEAMDALRRDASRLRAEVAMAIARKRASPGMAVSALLAAPWPPVNRPRIPQPRLAPPSQASQPHA